MKCALFGCLSASDRITSLEADIIVGAQEQARQQSDAQAKATLESVQSSSEEKVNLDDRKLIFRKVAPPAELPKTEPIENSSSTAEVDLSQLDDLQVKQPVSIQLYATVYDGAYSKLVLRHEKKQYTAWTNLNFEYLQSIGSFETSNRRYSYFGMADRIDQSREIEIAQLAQAKGLNYSSRWEAPPVRFGSELEYVLVTEDPAGVPDEVYQQLDDLIGFYSTNIDQLELAYHNANELQAARERYEAANPEQPQDIVLNYSRISTTATE